MIHSGSVPNPGRQLGDLTRGVGLVLVSLGTSVDAAAVGLSLAFLKGDILLAALVIGLVSAVLGFVGSLLGNRLGKVFGKRMETLGGLLLMAIGARVLWTHLAQA